MPKNLKEVFNTIKDQGKIFVDAHDLLEKVDILSEKYLPSEKFVNALRVDLKYHIKARINPIHTKNIEFIQSAERRLVPDKGLGSRELFVNYADVKNILLDEMRQDFFNHVIKMIDDTQYQTETIDGLARTLSKYDYMVNDLLNSANRTVMGDPKFRAERAGEYEYSERKGYDGNTPQDPDIPTPE